MGIFRQFPYSNFHEMNMDEILKLMSEMQSEWESTKEEWASYKDFIDNYFDNLDITEELQEIINNMIRTGEFSDLVHPDIVDAVEAWLDENVTPTTPVVDKTLSISGAAADAKITGDKFIDIENEINNIDYPYIDAHLNTLKKSMRSNGVLIDSSTHLFSEPVYLPFNYEIVVKDTVNDILSDHAITIVKMENFSNNTCVNTSSQAVASSGLKNYGSFYPDKRYVAIDIKKNEGNIEITDINDYITFRYSKPDFPEIFENLEVPGNYYPLINSGSTVITSPDSPDKDRVWYFMLMAYGLEYIYSDVFAFDYALFDIDNHCLKQLSGSFETNFIEVPAQYNGVDVYRIRVNATIVNRNNNYHLYDAKNWLKNIKIKYNLPVSHDMPKNKDISNVLENIRLINNLYCSISSPIAMAPYEDDTIKGSVYNGFPYRMIIRNSVGIGVTLQGYLSCSLPIYFGALVNANEVNAPAHGAYGNVCATFLTNAYQNLKFISTTSLHHFYNNVMTQEQDLSKFNIGDIFFLDGGSVSPKKSNHVGCIFDKIYVNNILQYIIIGEADHYGTTLRRVTYPFIESSDMVCYRLRFEDLNISVPKLTEETIIPDDADTWKTINKQIILGEVKYFNNNNFVLFWGTKHNIYADNEQLVGVKCNSGTPIQTLIKVYKNNNLQGTYDVTDWLEGTTSTYRTFALTHILDGSGYYRVYDNNDNYMFEFYYYTRELTYTDTLDISFIGTNDWDYSAVLVRVLEESGLGRAAQYYYRFLTDAEIESEEITPTADEDQILVLNEYGYMEYNLSADTEDDESDTPTTP